METVILKENTSIENNTRYNSYTVQVDNKTIDIMLVSGNSNYINVRVNNASQRAFNGLGKDFQNIDEALNNYKCKRVRAAIDYIKYFK